MNSGDVNWVWVDIDGRGKSWQLAVCKWDENQFEEDEADLMIFFVHHDFDDYAENYEGYPMVRVDPPREDPDGDSHD